MRYINKSLTKSHRGREWVALNQVGGQKLDEEVNQEKLLELTLTGLCGWMCWGVVKVRQREEVDEGEGGLRMALFWDW